MLFSEQVSVPTNNCSLMFTLHSLSTLNPPPVSTLYHQPLFDFSTHPLLSTLLPLSAFYAPHQLALSALYVHSYPCCSLHSSPFLLSTLVPLSEFYTPHPFCSQHSSLFLISTLLTLSALCTPPTFCFLRSSHLPFLLSMFTPPLAALYTPPPFCFLRSSPFLLSMYTPPFYAFYAPHPFCSLHSSPFLLSTLLTLYALNTAPPFWYLHSSPFMLSTLLPLSDIYTPHPLCSQHCSPFLISALLTLSALNTAPLSALDIHPSFYNIVLPNLLTLSALFIPLIFCSLLPVFCPVLLSFLETFSTRARIWSGFGPGTYLFLEKKNFKIPHHFFECLIGYMKINACFHSYNSNFTNCRLLFINNVKYNYRIWILA